ncbi:hypothetical protein QYM36_010732, partial [Artemia franciscana]
ILIFSSITIMSSLCVPVIRNGRQFSTFIPVLPTFTPSFAVRHASRNIIWSPVVGLQRQAGGAFPYWLYFPKDFQPSEGINPQLQRIKK